MKIHYLMLYTFKDNQEVSYIQYIPNFLTNEELTSLTSWLKKQAFKKGDANREQIWFQKDGFYFSKQWSQRYPRWESESYSPVLLEWQDLVQEKIKTVLHPDVYCPTINSCLINKYRPREGIKPHRDNIDSFGPSPTIIGISAGESRDIFFTHNTNPDKMLSITLEPGSVFVMAGASQKYWKHSIPPNKQASGVRYSLTFREYKT